MECSLIIVLVNSGWLVNYNFVSKNIINEYDVRIILYCLDLRV